MPKTTRDMNARIMLRLERELLERARLAAVEANTVDHRGMISTSAWIRRAMNNELAKQLKA